MKPKKASGQVHYRWRYYYNLFNKFPVVYHVFSPNGGDKKSGKEETT
jgi:hypothetical protein